MDENAQYRMNPRRVEFTVDGDRPRLIKISVEALEKLTSEGLYVADQAVSAYQQHSELIHQAAADHPHFAEGDVFLRASDF